MVFASACIPGREALRSFRTAIVPGILAVLLAVAAVPATAQQSPQGGVQAPPAGPTTSQPATGGAGTAPSSQGRTGGGDLGIEVPGRGHNCSSKTPIS